MLKLCMHKKKCFWKLFHSNSSDFTNTHFIQMVQQAGVVHLTDCKNGTATCSIPSGVRMGVLTTTPTCLQPHRGQTATTQGSPSYQTYFIKRRRRQTPQGEPLFVNLWEASW